MRQLLLLSAVILTGCFPEAQRTDAQYDQLACYPKREGKPMTAPDFLSAGDAARDAALDAENERLLGAPFSGAIFTTWTRELRESRDCYERALRVNPDSYRGSLGLGTVYLMLGLRTQEPVVSASFFTTARKYFGQAYFLRSDQEDPLYYLAIVSILERRYPLADQILTYLLEVDFRRGEVLTLAGYSAERSGRAAEAREFFRKAAEAGASTNTLVYVTNRLKGRGGE